MKKQFKSSPMTLMWRRLRKNKAAIFGMTVLAIIIFFVIFADIMFNYEENAITQHISDRMLKPFSPGHIFGTDQFGRDVFARLVYGARLSLSIGIITVLISTFIGVVLGAVSAYYGGVVDTIIMRIVDVVMSIPIILLAIAIVAALGPSLINLVIALTITMIPKFARIIRSSILSIKNLDYIEAARAYGTGDLRIISKHIIPNAIGPIIIQATLYLGITILNIAALSFIGMGVQPPAPEWGSMLSQASKYIRTNEFLIIIPGIAIALSVLATNLLGDGLRDALDPRMKN